MKRNDIVMVALPPPLGGKPVLIDSERRSWNIDPAMVAETVERKARQGKRPKAVVSVHLYGQSAELAPILEICARYAIPVHRGRRRGAGRHVSGQSAGNLGQGGRLLLQRQQDHHHLGQHSEIGYNYRLSNVLTGIGRGQLQVIEERVQARQRNFAFNQETLGDLPGTDFMPEAPWGRHTRWLTVITVDPKQFGADREAIRLALEAENIEARPIWKPMHLQPVFAGCEAVGGAVAEEFFANGLCVPSGSNLSQADLERVTTVIRRVQPGK